MKINQLNILMLEDNNNDAEMIQRGIVKHWDCRFRLVMTESDYRKALEEFEPDIILSDNEMPNFSGLEALHIKQAVCPNTPFILITGTVSEEFAVEVIKAGADDYLLKDRMVRLPAAMEAALRQKRAERENVEAHDQLRKSEEKYRSLIEQAADGVVIIAPDGSILEVNESACKATGYSKEDFIGSQFNQYLILDNDPVPSRLSELAGGNVVIQNRTIRRKDGSPLLVEVSNKVNADGNLICLIRDLSERLLAEEKLVKSEKRFRKLVENGNDAFAILNEQGNAIYVSASAEKILGYSEKEIMEMSLLSIVHPDNIQEVHQTLEQVMANPGVPFVGHISRLLHKDGTYHWYEDTITNMFHDPDIGGIVDNFRDITEKFSDQLALRESEEKYRNIVENITDIIYSHDLNGVLLDMNVAGCKLLGLSREALMGMNVGELLRSEHQAMYQEYLAYIKEHKRAEGLINLVNSNGETRVWEYKNSLKDDGGSTPIVRGFSSDVTDRILAENQLLKSKARYKALVENIGDSIVLIDEHAHVFYQSSSTARITGFEEDGETDLFDESNIHPEYREVWNRAYHEALGKPHSPIPLCFQFKHHKGHYIWLEGSLNNMLHDKSVKGIIVNLRDITARKQTEQMIEEAQNKLGKIASTSPGLIYSMRGNPDGSFEYPYASEAVKEIYGFSFQQIEFNPGLIFNLIHPSDKVALMENINRTKKYLVPLKGEYRYFHPDKGLVWHEVNSLPIQEPSGSVICHGIIIDITERKKAEAELNEEREKFNRLSATVPGLIYSFRLTPNGKMSFPYASASFFEFFGYPHENMQEDASEVFNKSHSDDIHQILSSIHESAVNQTLWTQEFRYHHPQKGLVWYEGSSIPSIEPDQSVIWHGILLDITKRKQVEQSLKSNEEKRRLIMNAAMDAIICIDMQGMVTFWNPQAERIFGWQEQEVLGKPLSGFIIPEEMRQQHEEGMHRYRESSYGPALNVLLEMTAINRRQEIFPVELTVLPIQEEGEEPFFCAFIRDISARKKAEEEIRISEEKYRVLVEEASEAIFISDTEGRFLTVNASACKIAQCTEEELLQMNYHQFFIPEDLARLPVRIDELRQGKTLVTERTMQRRDGTILQLEITSKLLSDGRLLALVRDVAERKQAQEALMASEEQYRTLVEQATDGIFIADSFGHFSLVNSAGCRLSGYSLEELKTKSIYDLVDKEELKENPFKFEEMRSHAGARSQRCLIRKDGSKVEVDISAKFLSDNRFIAFVRDMTKQREAEQELILSNERYNLVSKATNDAIWDFDVAKDTVVRLGESISKLFHYERNEIAEHHSAWEKLIHPDDVEEARNSIAEVFADPNAFYWEKEYRFKKADGTYANVYDKGYIIRNEAGKAIRMIGATQDITRLKENEARLKELNEHLQIQARALTESNAELEQFAYVASHDLQEPLRMVTSFLNLLEKKYKAQIDDSGRKYIRIAVDGASRMRQIIMDLLEFSRVGRNDGIREPVDVGQLVKEIEWLFIRTMEEKNATIVVENLPVIHTYRTSIQQVFQNLIGNALKYSKADLAPVVCIKAAEFDQYWQFEISDNGIGIEKQYFDKIFIIFQRLHNKDEFSGTGIGLAITKKIVESMGGRIWLASEPGVGSTFFFTLKK